MAYTILALLIVIILQVLYLIQTVKYNNLKKDYTKLEWKYADLRLKRDEKLSAQAYKELGIIVIPVRK